MELRSTLLNLIRLVCCSLTCGIDNSLHLSELDCKLHDLAEGLSKKVDLDRACLQCDRHVVPRIALRLAIKRFIAEVCQVFAFNGNELPERRLFRNSLINIINQRQVTQSSTDT